MGYTLNDHWVTESLRLRESLWGPLEDSAEAGRARAQGGSFEARLLTRSRLLAQREGLTDTLTNWRMVARLTLLLFAAAAFVVGCGAAMGALGRGGSVNLAPAVVALLGLNTLAFLLWLASFGMQATGATGSLLASAWLKLTHKLVRGPDAALLPRALLELLARQRLQRWSAGVLSHWFWTLALSGALLTLLGMLATRRYTFQWETTLLSPDTFVLLVQGLGWLPSVLGFPQPSAGVIRSSGGLHSLPESAHALWSVWLIGLVVVYGLLPRIVALLLSVAILRRRLARLAIDPSLPGLAELHDRLMPASESTGIDAPAPLPQPASLHQAQRPAGVRSQLGLLGLELPADLLWPPQPVPPGVDDLGIVDTREQRRQVLDALRRQPAQRLLVCCDARQTPDRGALALLTELASLSSEIRLALLPEGEPPRRQQWQRQLLDAGFMPEQIDTGAQRGLQWLAEHKQHDAGCPAQPGEPTP